ncbi:hypothetical protein BaRGS_00003441, partial [Batillaria attramentaria]
LGRREPFNSSSPSIEARRKSTAPPATYDTNGLIEESPYMAPFTVQGVNHHPSSEQLAASLCVPGSGRQVEGVTVIPAPHLHPGHVACSGRHGPLHAALPPAYSAGNGTSVTPGGRSPRGQGLQVAASRRSPLISEHLNRISYGSGPEDRLRPLGDMPALSAEILLQHVCGSSKAGMGHSLPLTTDVRVSSGLLVATVSLQFPQGKGLLGEASGGR